MGFSSSYANSEALYVFNNTALPTITTNLYISLHSADPTSGTQSTNEISYTGYGRATVVQSNVGWTVTGANAVNASEILFGQCTAGSATATYVGIGNALSGAGTLIMSGALSSPSSVSISAGHIPRFAASALSITFS